jgi:class 3 adenylate cyclase
MEHQFPFGQPLVAQAFREKHRTGLVTLLFTDTVGSTALKRQFGDRPAADLFRKHDELIRQTLRQFTEAEEISTAGDSFFLVFATPSHAVKFALVAQTRLRSFYQESGFKAFDRMGIHVGEVLLRGRDQTENREIFGIQIDTCARVMSLANAGQILMTRAVFDSARQVLKGEDIEGISQLEWLNHGPYLLKGLEEPVEVCEVREQGHATAAPPTNSEKAQRHTRADQEPVLGWRPAVAQAVPNTRWILEKKLGEGGFGEVWLGRHQHTKERRVFKFCFEAKRVRFLKREMTLFRLLKERVGDHANIVRLHDVYLEQPPFYIEMDYVEGADLMTWCAQRGIPSIPLHTRLEIVAQAADGLQAAHEAGIIHRDIKPGNILIAERESPNAVLPSVKLSDFGIGQIVSEEALGGITRAGFTQTVAGESSSHTGTQLYMAPELLAGKPASTRSDIYSLGVVLYQLLAGDLRAPLTSDWWKHISDPLLREDLEHCFAGNPQERFAGVGQLARHLRALPERQAAFAERARSERRRARARLAAVLAAILLLLALALGYGLFQARTEAFKARQNQYEADMLEAHRAIEENNLDLALSYLNQHVPRRGQVDLRGWEWRYLWGLCRSDEMASFLPDVPFRWVWHMSMSRDGKFLAAAQGGSRHGAVKVWEFPSGKLYDMPEANESCGSVSFSPDGKLLAFATWNQGLKLWDLHARHQIASLPGRYGYEWNQGDAIFSPDGHFLAASAADDNGPYLAVFDMSTQPFTSKKLRGHEDGIGAAARRQTVGFLRGQPLLHPHQRKCQPARTFHLGPGSPVLLARNRPLRPG